MIAGAAGGAIFWRAATKAAAARRVAAALAADAEAGAGGVDVSAAVAGADPFAATAGFGVAAGFRGEGAATRAAAVGFCRAGALVDTGFGATEKVSADDVDVGEVFRGAIFGSVVALVAVGFTNLSPLLVLELDRAVLDIPVFARSAGGAAFLRINRVSDAALLFAVVILVVLAALALAALAFVLAVAVLVGTLPLAGVLIFEVF